MLWACLLAYVTGMVNQELLQRNEYLGEGDKVTLARREVAPRLGRQAQENLAATANPGHHSRAGQIYATIGGSLLRSAELSGGGGSRKCNAKSGK